MDSNHKCGNQVELVDTGPLFTPVSQLASIVFLKPLQFFNSFSLAVGTASNLTYIKHNLIPSSANIYSNSIVDKKRRQLNMKFSKKSSPATSSLKILNSLLILR